MTTSTTPTFQVPQDVLKGQAKRLLVELRHQDPGAKLHQAQAVLARTWGEDDWHTLIQRRTGALPSPTITARPWGLRDLGPTLLVQLLVRHADAGMWLHRATGLVDALVDALFERHERQGTLDRLTPTVLRDTMLLDNLVALRNDPRLSTERRDSITGYLHSLPQFSEGQGPGTFHDTTLDQHGYLQMQFGRVLRHLDGWLAMADTVVWRWAWTWAIDDKALPDALRGSWLDHATGHSLRGLPLFTLAARPVVRLRDLLVRYASTASAPEIQALQHWLDAAVAPGSTFVQQAQRLGLLLDQPAGGHGPVA